MPRLLRPSYLWTMWSKFTRRRWSYYSSMGCQKGLCGHCWPAHRKIANTPIPNLYRATCISLAVKGAHPDIVKRLVDYGFKWNLFNIPGSDSLQLTIIKGGGHSHVEPLLLSTGATISDDVHRFRPYSETGEYFTMHRTLRLNLITYSIINISRSIITSVYFSHQPLSQYTLNSCIVYTALYLQRIRYCDKLFK